jgi:hypothetical protein
MTDNHYIVFSADRSSSTEVENGHKQEYIENYLDRQGIAYDVLEGAYKEVVEVSYIASAEHSEVIEAVLAATSPQECTMYLTAHHHGLYKAYLRDSSGEYTHTGYLRSVTREIARKFESYTKREGKYWIVTPFDDVRMDIVTRKLDELTQVI